MASKNTNIKTMKNNPIITGTIIMIIMISLVSAFGVAGYTDPVKVSPGESIDLAFRVQNLVGTEDYELTATIMNEPEINVTRLDQSNTYELRQGTIVRVNFRVTVPKEAEIGKKYQVRADFKTGPLNKEGETLGIESVIGDKVIIEVAGTTDDTKKITPQPEETKEKPASNTNKIIALIILVIIVGLAIWYIKRKKNYGQQA